MKIIKLYFICMLSVSKIWAQAPEQAPESRTMISTPAGNSLYGKLVDKITGKPIVAGSVQIYGGANNRDSLFDGMLSKPNGEFGFRKLPATDSILLVISALGYLTQEQVIVNTRRQKGEPQNFKKDLGKILLQTDIKQLSEVVVTSVRPAYEMGIDRKVFDVSKSLLATGGTAIDIMKSIPSVSVDIEGNVELRRSSPQIFVDGRPTILTLDQIPADHVDKIELITNPSAKFDAATSGGIINVVLKKNKRIGLNGVANISAGVPELLSGNLTLNLRQGKFNFFTTLNHNQSGGIAKGQTLRENKKGGVVTDYFNQYSDNQRERNYSTVRFGTDFFINNRNTITISQDFSGGTSANLETQDQEYLDFNQTLIYTGIRTGDGESRYNRGSSRINYKHSFPKEGKELTADVNYNYGDRSGNSDLLTLYYNPDGSQYRIPSDVWTDGRNKENQFTFQSDYENPVNERTKIEAGIRSFHNKFASFYNAYTNENGQVIKLPLSNNYEYIEKVNAAYFTYSYKKKSYSYQLGLRGEYSLFDGELIDSAYKFGYEYPKKMSNIWDALFPSFFVTKKVSESEEVQFNFSRRIRRPQFWQLNPFVEINDPANLRQGNPDLKPEFVNSFEFNYSRTYTKGNFLAAIYFRNNPNDITEYSDTITDAQYLQFANAAIDPNAILNTYINANTTNRYGAEFTIQHKFSKRFDITPTVDFQYRTVNATVDNIDLSNAGFNWEAKLTANYKIENEQKPLFNNLGFQLILDYESPEIIPQGRRISEFVVDIAMRKDFMKNKKASLTFAVSDLFNGNRWGAMYDTEQFYQESYRRWSIRTIRLTFSYKFGDTNFSLFSGNRGGNNDDD